MERYTDREIERRSSRETERRRSSRETERRRSSREAERRVPSRETERRMPSRETERRSSRNADRRRSTREVERQSSRDVRDSRASREGAMSRREEMRRRRVELARRKKQRLLLIITMAVIGALLVGGIIFGIYKLLEVDYVAEGTELYVAEDYENALIAFETAIEKGDDLAEAYLGIAYCSWELGDYEDLATTFDNAYLNGASVTGASRSLLATIALQDEDYELALQYIQEGLDLDGNSVELTQEFLKNEIVCYEELGDWTTAYEKIQEYNEAYPDDEEAATEAEFLETR